MNAVSFEKLEGRSFNESVGSDLRQVLGEAILHERCKSIIELILLLCQLTSSPATSLKGRLGLNAIAGLALAKPLIYNHGARSMELGIGQ